MKMHARDPKLEAQQNVDPDTGLVGAQWTAPDFDPPGAGRGSGLGGVRTRRLVWGERFALAKENPGQWMKCGPYTSSRSGSEPRKYRRELLEQGENFDATMRSTPQERIDGEYFVYIRYNGKVGPGDLALAAETRADEVRQKAREREIRFMQTVKGKRVKAKREDHARRVREDDYAAMRSEVPPDATLFSVNKNEDVG